MIYILDKFWLCINKNKNKNKKIDYILLYDFYQKILQ